MPSCFLIADYCAKARSSLKVVAFKKGGKQRSVTVGTNCKHRGETGVAASGTDYDNGC